jgi:hypothetical protein
MKSRQVDKKISRKSRKAEKQSRQAEKQEKQKSRELDNQRTRQAEKQEKQKSREAGKHRTRNPKKFKTCGKKINSPPYINPNIYISTYIPLHPSKNGYIPFNPIKPQ